MDLSVYRSLFDGFPEAVVVTDDAGAICYANGPFEQLSGYPACGLAGRRLETLVLPAAGSGQPGAEPPDAAAAPAERNGPALVVHKDGAHLFVELQSGPIAGDGGEPVARLTVLRRFDPPALLAGWSEPDPSQDVASRQEADGGGEDPVARSALEQRNRKLEQANESLRHFTSIASHDMQEPLRKIRFFSDLLAQAVKAGNRADIDYALTVLTDAARRASTLVSDLLDFSRAQNKEFDRETIDLKDLVDGVVREVQRESDAGPATISVVMPRLFVSGDRTAIIQLFRNLIGNALKYRHPERQPEIEIRADVPSADDAPAIVRIRDNGIGFEPEYARMIMKPFSRLHRRSQYPGSGVGLAICDVVAQRHNWALRAEGRPGEGATFELTIPTHLVAGL